MNCTDPRVYTIKTRKYKDPENPSFHDAMHGQYAPEYQNTIVTEVKELMRKRTWKHIPRENVPLDKDGNKRQVLKGNWVFKLKHLPNGPQSKFKARYCVRGDTQREGVDYFDTYAPVV